MPLMHFSIGHQIDMAFGRLKEDALILGINTFGTLAYQWTI